MDIHLLVISAGNSRVALGVFVAGELTRSVRVANEDTEALERGVRDLWAEVAGHDSAAIAAATVNPPGREQIEAVVERITGREVQWVGDDIDLPIPVRTLAPEKTGVDRVLNVAAAYEQLGKACVVVDAGTAVTISFCDDAGQFLGGAIAPGARLQLDSLHRATAQLPSITLERPDGNFGNDTASAMRHGVFHGIRGMVKELLENFATHLTQWPELIATGGDAELLFGDWELTHAVSPDLTLYGVALAYTNHHIKHDS